MYLLLTDKEKLTQRLLVYLLTVAGFYFAVGVSLMLGLVFSLSWIMCIVGIILIFNSLDYL
ncbi:hypothetical protein ASG99_13080 [Bacillus sp. Soil768D1]|nr:hypothetical protein ASG99_13080 [Bacillus sp. Soil768D1]